MLIKVFVLGRPGSGKTTAFRRISALLNDKGWPITRIRDYGILQGMSRHEIEGKKFRPADHGGFDVVDFSVLDNALVEVERQVRLRMLTVKEKELIVVANELLMVWWQIAILFLIIYSEATMVMIIDLT